MPLVNSITRSQRRKGWSWLRHFLSPVHVLSHLLVGVLAFYFGFVAGGDGRRTTPSKPGVFLTPQSSSSRLFPDTVRDLFAGSAAVPRSDFIKEYDIGVPWDESKKGSNDVLILYSSHSSLPKDHADHGGGASTVFYKTARDATANCTTMKVILTQRKQENVCFAVVAQWDSFHVHKFMRLKAEDDQSDGAAFRTIDPPIYVSRHELSSNSLKFPTSTQTRRYWPMLIDYLQKLESTVERLKPIAVDVAGNGNTIVVMVCNFGQSELLFNFVCSARARALDLSHVLLFATDSDIAELAKSLKIAVFDVEDAFGQMPTRAARSYGDRAFQGMMMSKVYCVHLINALGYDLLFQDVDVVWHRDPLEYFHSRESGNFDFYFQDGEEVSLNFSSPLVSLSSFYYLTQLVSIFVTR